MKDKSALATEHCKNTVMISHLEESADADAIIHNLRFMAFCAGYEKAKEQTKELVEKAIEMARDGWVACREHNDRYVQYVKPVGQVLNELGLTDKGEG